MTSKFQLRLSREEREMLRTLALAWDVTQSEVLKILVTRDYNRIMAETARRVVEAMERHATS